MMKSWVAPLMGILLVIGIPVHAEVSVSNGQLALDVPVLFQPQSDVLEPASENTLMQVKKFMDAKSAISTLRIEGHVAAGDNMGKEQALSEARALAVLKWLVAHGISCNRLMAVGFGVTKPVAQSDSPAARAQNSRITFAPAALQGHVIGGMPLNGGGKEVEGTCNIHAVSPAQGY